MSEHPERRRTSIWYMAELRLIPLCTTGGEIKKPNVVGKGAGLVQENYPVLASVDGERLSGKMQGECYYDWMSGPGGIGTVRVVANIQTDDGASINVRYEARAEISNGFDGVVAYSAPVFTTSHSGYLWLNLIQTVGRVTIQGNHIYWDWYQVAEAG